LTKKEDEAAVAKAKNEAGAKAREEEEAIKKKAEEEGRKKQEAADAVPEAPKWALRNLERISREIHENLNFIDIECISDS
jgi:hypothetical protein